MCFVDLIFVVTYFEMGAMAASILVKFQFFVLMVAPCGVTLKMGSCLWNFFSHGCYFVLMRASMYLLPD